MIVVNFNEFLKVADYIRNETNGDNLVISTEQTKLVIKTKNKKQQDIEITLHDVDFPFKPTIRQTTEL